MPNIIIIIIIIIITVIVIMMMMKCGLDKKSASRFLLAPQTVPSYFISLPINDIIIIVIIIIIIVTTIIIIIIIIIAITFIVIIITIVILLIFMAQVERPLTMKKDGIQTRNRKLSAKVGLEYQYS